MMEEICPKLDCTGCQVCGDACPTKAISYREDEFGHIYPFIDQGLCIDCKKCERTCPSVNHPHKNPSVDEAFACWIKDQKNRMKSTSGAISYSFSKWILENNGIFVGVTWDSKSNNASHVIIDNVESLDRCQGSKYSHSNTTGIYKKVKEILSKGTNVLFSGTPCQIAALKSYLVKDYDNLFTIGLVCHGVPSRKLLRDRIKMIEEESGNKIIDYKSRVKTPDQYLSSCQYTFENGKKLHISVFKDFFFRIFVTNYGLRPNCFRCQYSCAERVEDVTVADFWGYNPLSLKYRDYRKGTSLVLLNTEKGKRMFEEINCNLIIDNRTFSEAQSCNRNLSAPQDKPKDYESFWISYLNGYSLKELCLKYAPPRKYKRNITTEIKILLKMILPSFILKRVKK